MRTTIDIDVPLLDRAKQYAADHGKQLAEVVNDALTEKLGREQLPTSGQSPFRFLTFGQEGVQPGINVNSNVDLEDSLKEVVRDPKTGQLDPDSLR